MANPVLVEVYRGEVLESFHRGVICMVNQNDEVIYSLGDIEQLCFPRSAMKFFQQIPLLTSGAVEHFGFTQKEIAIFCGSHNGEAIHVETVRGILDKIGLTEDDLECGPQMPTLKEDAHYLIKHDMEPKRIQNNCSGKHAGFLAYCVYKKLPVKDYINPEHPLHQAIMKIVSEFHRYPLDKIKVGIDGCSAPIFAFPVKNQAIAYKNLVSPVEFDEATRKACKMMVDSITAFPEMIAGKRRYCTDLMKEAGGKLIGKTGADGIYSIGLVEQKYGICIKVDDGKMGPQYNVAQSVIEQLGILSSEQNKKLHGYVLQETKNFGGLLTGETRTCLNVKVVLNKAG
jgi:L-asparaginase II